jgi:hypothetical protein
MSPYVKESSDPEAEGDGEEIHHPHPVPDARPGDIPRRWFLFRKRDETGMSGTGIVAWGIQWPGGMVAYKWSTSPSTIQIAQSPYDVQQIHGHDYDSEVRFLDEWTAEDPEDEP